MAKVRICLFVCFFLFVEHSLSFTEKLVAQNYDCNYVKQYHSVIHDMNVFETQIISFYKAF